MTLFVVLTEVMIFVTVSLIKQDIRLNSSQNIPQLEFKKLPLGSNSQKLSEEQARYSSKSRLKVTNKEVIELSLCLFLSRLPLA